MVKRDVGPLRISELQLAVMALDAYQRCTRQERQIAMAELLTRDLLRHRRPDWEMVDDEEDAEVGI